MQEEEEADFSQEEPSFDFQEEEGEPRARRTRGQVGGRRQQRRVALINSRLASGEYRPEDVELVGALEGWIYPQQPACASIPAAGSAGRLPAARGGGAPRFRHSRVELRSSAE